MALLFQILNRKCRCPLIFRNFLSKIFRKSKMGYAPHHLASQGAGCRSCRKRQFGKKSPRGEALTQGKGKPWNKARGSLGSRKNFNIPLSARGCSPLSPKGKARGLKNKERPLQLAEVDSFPVWEATKRLKIFADFCNSKNRVKERRAKKRAPLIRRRAATPFPPRKA